ncbi:hypothetical protein C3B59_17940 [Cryobacterium zongtaii]|uniref:Uncharacterized protein n=2 Tax=Cryobacterium zongtaii TaxID=1259217 RepID=A0A2S3Z593_9MICO|nr:hypothetical protein C3B59_17940 [Cryobacterium zongtaii]
MTRDSTPQLTGEGQQHQDSETGGAAAGTVPGSALPVVAGGPPSHWLFWSYLWRYSLLFVVLIGGWGTYWGIVGGAGNPAYTDQAMVVDMAVTGFMFGALGQVIAFAVALTLFIRSMPARRRWAAHREAGWTTAQCRADDARRSGVEHTRMLNARLRKLGLRPVPPPTPWTPPPPKKPTIMSRLSVVLFLVMLVIAAVIFASPWLDTRVVQSIQCEVVSAEPRTTSSGSRGSVTTVSVLVKTQDCGPLAIHWGVTSDNQDEIAASFIPGATYEFDVGWFSRTFFKNGIQSARDYRLIG